jgi:hypothetical protein
MSNYVTFKTDKIGSVYVASQLYMADAHSVNSVKTCALVEIASDALCALLWFSETYCYEQGISSSITCWLTRICFINLDGQFYLTTLKQLTNYTVE